MIRTYLLTLVFILASSAGPAFAQRGGPASVFVEPVQEQSFSREIEALGTLEPNEQVDLTLNVADRVTSIFFDDGQRVREGKTLLSLAQREQVALVEASEATVEEARRQLERISRLTEADAVSQSELDAAQRNLDSAEANLRAVQSRQRDRVLVAPFDGVLGFRQVSVGSFVRAGDVVATLIDDSEMNLDFDVPSTFLRSVQPGTAIFAETDDLPGELFEGTIATLDNRIDPITRSVRARASLPNDDLLLRSGMFMRVTVTAEPRVNLAVPESAIQPIGPQSFVWVVREEEDGRVARRILVELGQRSNGYVEVRDGLDRGDLIITEGIIRVREGSPVVIRDRDILEPESMVLGNGAAAGPSAQGAGN
ncbi:MAG: efflux RND transporter periplasmic adaptor subunit [Henriciella sp.]|nr:efflux RND transporter periplasmic adaptor subunit [Henriciella sp.]